MQFELLSKQSRGSPLITLMDALLSTDQRDTISKLQNRKMYLYAMGTFERLKPSTGLKKGNIFIWDHIPESVKTELIDGKADLLLDISAETIFVTGHEAKADLQEIYGAMHDLNIPPQRVILAHSNMAGQKYHEMLVSEMGITKPLRLWTLDFAMVWTTLFLEKDLAISHRIESTPDNALPENESPNDLRPFLCLVRKLKFHRVAALLAILALVGEDKVFFSLIGRNEEDYPVLERALKKTVEVLNEISDRYPSVDWLKTANDILAKTFPITLPGDDGSFGDGKADGLRSVSGKWYDSTLISVVGESLFTNGQNLFITEKVMKPIYWSHPFIVVGDPGTLARLRTLGFRTFGAVIDESYDEITDPVKRLHAIIAELNRIGRFSPDQLKQAKQTLAADVRHNFCHVRTGFRELFAQLFIDSFTKILVDGE